MLIAIKMYSGDPKGIYSHTDISVAYMCLVSNTHLLRFDIVCLCYKLLNFSLVYDMIQNYDFNKYMLAESSLCYLSLHVAIPFALLFLYCKVGSQLQRYD